MQEFDPLGIGSYMRSRMRELIGTDVLGAEPFEVPRFALNEPSQLIEEMPAVGTSSEFYVNPEVEWAFPETELVMPTKGPAQIGETARGHRQIPGGGTEILETTNTRPVRPPRRLFRVDVTENDENYFLRADLAGMAKENVKISVMEDRNLVSINVEPPKDDFFGLYKSPLESTQSIKQQQQTEQEPAEKEPVPPALQHQELSHKKEVCHLIERCTQSMSRTLKMPKAVDMSKVEAEMRDGLLMVKFAKKEHEAEESKKHFVEIK